jgi:hypothetical protein
MLYNSTNYAKVFHPNKSLRTVQRMIKSGLIPSGHIKVEGVGRNVLVDTTCTEFAKEYQSLISKFKRCKSNSVESAAAFCVENDLDMHLFCKHVGL